MRHKMRLNAMNFWLLAGAFLLFSLAPGLQAADPAPGRNSASRWVISAISLAPISSRAPTA